MDWSYSIAYSAHIQVPFQVSQLPLPFEIKSSEGIKILDRFIQFFDTYSAKSVQKPNKLS